MMDFDFITKVGGHCMVRVDFLLFFGMCVLWVCLCVCVGGVGFVES